MTGGEGNGRTSDPHNVGNRLTPLAIRGKQKIV